MKKRGKTDSIVHFVLTIGSKSSICKRIKKSKIFFVKSTLSLLIILFLSLLLNNYYSVYREKKLLEYNINQVANEIEYLKEKRRDIGEYKIKINNLLGYEIYKDYLKNSEK